MAPVKSVLDGLACLQALFQQGKIIVDASCSSLIHALQNYKWDFQEGEEKLSRENHVMMLTLTFVMRCAMEFTLFPVVNK